MLLTNGDVSLKKSKLNVLLATFSANLAAVAAGCVLTWSSPTLAKITKPGHPIFVTKDESVWLSSLVAVGAALGPFMASSLVNRIGRKWTVIVDMLVFLVSWTILATCTRIYWLYLARIVAGIAVGIVFTTVPIYVAEISSIDLRGAMGSLMQFFLCIGFLISYIVGPYTSYITLIYVSAAVPLVCALVFVWFPETPQYLLSRNRKDEALASLEWLRGYPEPIRMQSEITDILAAVDEAKHNKGSVKELFAEKGYRKALYYACSLAFFQQMSGVNVVLFYAQTIFDATGSPVSSSIAAIFVGFVMTLAAALTPPAAKILRIRHILCFSAIGEAISLGCLGLFLYLKDRKIDVTSLYLLPVTSLVFFFFSYSVGFGPFVWVIMAEIFPAHLKAIASALTASFCWLLSFLLTRFFRMFTERFGQPPAYFVFATFCVLALLFVAFQLPDTQGKTYQDIQEMLTGKKNADFSDELASLIF